MEIIKVETNKNKNYYFNESKVKFKKYSPKQEAQVVNIYPDITYQTFEGFGACITEAAAYSYSLLPPDKKIEYMRDMFLNINYSLCRLTIGSCDFALGTYSYAKKHDLSDFNIERDEKYIIPFIKDALAVNPNIRFLASPWSPPRFMKNIKITKWGGKLLNKYKQTYADYFVKYINAYKNLGINIDYVTVQNETNAAQIWESCKYTPENEADFVANYLYPTFQNNNINTKILVYDHNKEKLFTRAVEEFKTPEARQAISGLAFHWYSGNHFENISLCRESCFSFDAENSHPNQYAHDICEDLNAGINGYIDWNILLDSIGGPNHKKNYCSSPVMLTSTNLDYRKTLAYYYIGHFSRYIKPGSVKLVHSKYLSDIRITAFKNPDNTIAIVMMNSAHYNIEFNLCIDKIMFKDTLEPDCIITYLIKN